MIIVLGECVLAASTRAADGCGVRGHYLIFGALAALGAGLQVAADATHETTALTPDGVALTVAIPLAIYLGATAVLHGRSASRRFLSPIPVVVVLVRLVSVAARWIGVPSAIVAMGLLVSGLVAFNVVAMHREGEAQARTGS